MKTPDDPLIFQSPPRHQHDWLLPLMIMASLGIHGLSFYLIQTSSPHSTSLAPTSARLSILNPQSPADQKILKWIESHDPGQIARKGRLLDPPTALLEVPYRPGYSQNLPEIQSIIDSSGPTNFPSITDPGMVRVSPSRKKAFALQKTQARRSNVQFSEGFTLQPGKENKLSPPFIGDLLPEPTRFLVLRNADGELKNAFLQTSSGDDALDLYALQWLRKNRYAGGAESYPISGQVSFFWGGEIFTPKKK